MTKDGSFKRAVRRHADATGKSYTRALATMRNVELDARMFERSGTAELGAHLETTYGIRVASMTTLDRHAGGVLRIDHDDGAPWVARVFSDARPVRYAYDDAELLRMLERNDYPIARVACGEPVSVYEGQAVLVTRFVPGERVGGDARGLHVCADLLGRLHTMPHVGYAGGCMHPDPAKRGPARTELEGALHMLELVEPHVTAKHRAAYERLRSIASRTDASEGLPEALTHGNLTPHVVLDGPGGPVVTDWTKTGVGPRLAAVANLLWGAGNVDGGDDEIVDAIADGYCRHVRPEQDELARLGGALRLRELYYACFRYWRIGASAPKRWDDAAAGEGDITAGMEGHWPEEELADALAAKAVASFTNSGRGR